MKFPWKKITSWTKILDTSSSDNMTLTEKVDLLNKNNSWLKKIINTVTLTDPYEDYEEETINAELLKTLPKIESYKLTPEEIAEVDLLEKEWFLQRYSSTFEKYPENREWIFKWFVSKTYGDRGRIKWGRVKREKLFSNLHEALHYMRIEAAKYDKTTPVVDGFGIAYWAKLLTPIEDIE